MNHTFHIKSASAAIALALGFSVFSTASMARPDDLNASPLVESFDKLDVNNDGVLSKVEAGKDKLFTPEHFAHADVDHNGTLSQKEFGDYKSAAQDKEAKRVFDDTVITSKIKAYILKDEGLKSLDVSVETHNGIVQLSGFVSSKDQVTTAERIAKTVEGVKSVRNDLIVKG